MLLLALIAVPLGWAPGPHPVRPAEPAQSVPSRVRGPMPLQPNLVDSPNGPASVIVTGPGGFGANDVFGFDDRAIVVGRDGLYRYVRDINSVDAGESLLLSPDGRYLAGRADLEGVDSGDSAADWQASAAVMDLTTGKVRTYHQGTTVAWAPGDRLAIWNGSDCGPACPASYHDLRLSLVDIGTGAVTDARLDPVRAVSARLLGWQTDGDAVVVLTMTNHEPTGPQAGVPQVLALHPGGGQRPLITVTADADRIDVARDLLDHFGGDPRSGWAMVLDVTGVRLPQTLPWLAAIAVLMAVVLAYRRYGRHG